MVVIKWSVYKLLVLKHTHTYPHPHPHTYIPTHTL